MKISDTIPVFPISVVSRLTGISIRMLREYDSEGLIRPQRVAGRRLFSHNEVDFVGEIKFYLKEKKMGIAGLKEFYLRTPCWESKKCRMRKCPAYKNLSQRCWKIVKHHKKCNSIVCPSCPVYLVYTTQKKERSVKKNLKPVGLSGEAISSCETCFKHLSLYR